MFAITILISLHSAYIEDENVCKFIQEYNPDAFNEIIARFTEAIDRGLWAPRRNATYNELMEWKNVSNNNERKTS